MWGNPELTYEAQTLLVQFRAYIPLIRVAYESILPAELPAKIIISYLCPTPDQVQASSNYLHMRYNNYPRGKSRPQEQDTPGWSPIKVLDEPWDLSDIGPLGIIGVCGSVGPVGAVGPQGVTGPFGPRCRDDGVTLKTLIKDILTHASWWMSNLTNIIVPFLPIKDMANIVAKYASIGVSDGLVITEYLQTLEI